LQAQHVSSSIPLIIRSSKLYLQPLVYIPMWWPVVVRVGWELPPSLTTTDNFVYILYIVMTMYNIYEIFYLIAVYKPEAANTVWSSWWWAVCRSKHVEPSTNCGIINSITRLHLAGCFYWFILRCTDPWILNLLICTLGDLAMHYPVYTARLLDCRRPTLVVNMKISDISLFFVLVGRFACLRLLPFTVWYINP